MDEKAPILLVEDDEVDVMTLERAFRKEGVPNPLHVAASAKEALAMLRGEGRERLAPKLILFDVNLPGLDGIGLLRELRADPALRAIPSIALTSSNQPRDREAAFDLHVAGYFVKQVAYEESLAQVGVILRYWRLSEVP